MKIGAWACRAPFYLKHRNHEVFLLTFTLHLLRTQPGSTMLFGNPCSHLRSWKRSFYKLLQTKGNKTQNSQKKWDKESKLPFFIWIMLQKPLLGKTKAAEINWFAYRWREMRCDGNKGSQHTRSQVLGDSVQRRLPLRCLAISSAQQTAARCSLEGKKRVSEPSVNNLSPANGGGGMCRQSEAVTFSSRRDRPCVWRAEAWCSDEMHPRCGEHL